jgi:hypothetical protein
MGREQGPLLQALLQWRFVAHAVAPALTFVAAEMAEHGGVTCATQSGFQSARSPPPLPFPLDTLLA